MHEKLNLEIFLNITSTIKIKKFEREQNEIDPGQKDIFFYIARFTFGRTPSGLVWGEMKSKIEE